MSAIEPRFAPSTTEARMNMLGRNLRKAFWSAAISFVLILNIIGAALGDGPGGLGKILPPSQGTLQGDGTVLYANGVVLYPNGNVAWHDSNNTVWYPTVLTDGSFLYVDGTVLHPNGTVDYPTGGGGGN